MNKGKRVEVKSDGQRGIVEKVINGCLFVRMDDGTSSSGAKRYYRPERKRKPKESMEAN